MKKTIVFFLLFTIYCSLCRFSAQSRTIDSLLRIVNPENGQVYADTMKVNVYNKLCGEYDNRSDFENGLKYGNMGLELAKKIGFRKGEAKCYTNLGNILDDQSDYSKAIDYYMKSIKIGTEINDTYVTAVAYNDMGLIYMYQSDYPKALDCYLKSLNLNELRKDKKGMSTNFNNIGIIYMNQNDYKKALEYGLKSLKTDEELGDKKGVADSYSNIGIIYERQKEYEQALNYFLKSKKIREQLGLREALANSYSNIADIYTNIFITDTAGAGLTTSDNEHIAHSHLLDSSLALENKALAVNKEIGNKYIVTYIMLGIGNVYFNQKKYKEALEYYKKDYVLADSLGALNEETNIAKALSGCYFKMHDYEKALEWYQKFVQIGDSVFNGAKNKEITNKTLKFEFDKKAIADSVKTDEEKKVISAELKQEQTKSYALYGGLALLLAFAGLMYNRFKITHKQKNIIELKEKETEKQKNVVEEKNKQITKSIEYALRIQTAILPPPKTVKQYLQNSFILYKPKDIVAGDFYWMETVLRTDEGHPHIGAPGNQIILFAACDCTGHGVPGAMVSVVCHNALNRAVREFGLTKPADILDKTTEIIMENFAKSEEEITDGMDISLCSLTPHPSAKDSKQPATYTLQWAGANNPLWIVRGNSSVVEKDSVEVFETKADKQPVGRNENHHPFTNHSFELYAGDTIYLFTDGFADQFGGVQGEKKLTRKRFKEILVSVQHLSMKEQGRELDKFILDYRKSVEQIDDILVMGIRV